MSTSKTRQNAIGNPGLPLPGMAASEFLRWTRCAPYGLIPLAVGLTLGLVANGQADPLRSRLNAGFFILLAVGFVFLFLCTLAGSFGYYKALREKAAGYTTFGTSRLPLDVLDPQTGFVVRSGTDEPFASQAAYRDALVRVRTSAGGGGSS